MKLSELVDELSLSVRCANDALDQDVTGGYASDLLSDVMANAQKGNVWITLQIHQNIVAVASLNELAGIILINKREPEEDAVKKAEEEHIPILVSDMPAFDLVGRLYELGVRGAHKA
jgi:hypothetical protein